MYHQFFFTKICIQHHNDPLDFQDLSLDELGEEKKAKKIGFLREIEINVWM